MEIRELSLAEWGNALPDRGFEVFHHPDALRVVDEHAGADLRLFGGYRGEQLAGLLPVFTRRILNASAVLSPPPAMYVPRLGPLVMSNSPKRRKREEVNRSFTVEVLEQLDADGPFTVVGINCSPAYSDPRPYVWEGFDVEPRFWHSLPLKGRSPEDVLKSFSKSLRRDVRDGEELDVGVETRSVDAAREIYETMERRYREQGMEFPVPWGFVRDVVDGLDDRARVYVAENGGGETLGGIVALYSNDAAYFWLGGTRAEYEGVNVNSLLHWRIIEDAITDPNVPAVDRYELGRVDIERLSRYKSKFNPELVSSYMIKSGKIAAIAQEIHGRLTR